MLHCIQWLLSSAQTYSYVPLFIKCTIHAMCTLRKWDITNNIIYIRESRTPAIESIVTGAFDFKEDLDTVFDLIKFNRQRRFISMSCGTGR